MKSFKIPHHLGFPLTTYTTNLYLQIEMTAIALFEACNNDNDNNSK